MSLDPYLTSYIKMYLKCIKNPNVEAGTRIRMFAGQPSRTADRDGQELATGAGGASAPTPGSGADPEQGPEDSSRQSRAQGATWPATEAI